MLKDRPGDDPPRRWPLAVSQLSSDPGLRRDDGYFQLIADRACSSSQAIAANHGPPP